MYYLGLDIGSSSIKAALVEVVNRKKFRSRSRTERRNEHVCSKKWLGRTRTKRLVVAYL